MCCHSQVQLSAVAASLPTGVPLVRCEDLNCFPLCAWMLLVRRSSWWLPSLMLHRSGGKSTAAHPRPRARSFRCFAHFCQATLAEFSESVVRGAAGASAKDSRCMCGVTSNRFRLTQLFKRRPASQSFDVSTKSILHKASHGSF